MFSSLLRKVFIFILLAVGTCFLLVLLLPKPSNFNDKIAFGTILVIVLALIFFLIPKKKSGKDWISITLVLFAGAALYYFAFFYNSNMDIVYSPYLMASSLSFSIITFVGNYNVQSTYTQIVMENQLYLIATIVHFLSAIFLTFLTVVKVFGKKLVNELRVLIISFFRKYIVIGFTGQAGIFLKNLDSKQRRKTIIIIKHDQIDKKWDLIDKGYAVVTVKEEKETKKKKKNDKKYQYDEFRVALKKAGAMKCIFKTNVISMSEQDETNLLIAMILTDFIDKKINKKNLCEIYLNISTILNKLLFKKDIDLKKEYKNVKEKKIINIKLIVRIMYSLLERAEHYSYVEKSKGKITFFNPYKLKAQKFWQKYPITKLIPFNWIDTEKAKLKRKYKINNIFIGFGSTNNAMLKTSIINNQLLNIDYNALVICHDAKKQEKIFKNSAIGLFDEPEKIGAEIKPNPDGNVYLRNPEEKNNIIFKKADAFTFKLYDYIIKEILGENTKNSVPYDYTTIIIALGDDKLSIETALELRQKLYEADLLIKKDNDNEYQRVKIFVKVYKNSILADNSLLNVDLDKFKCKIIPCGADEDIMTEDYIINEKLDILAKNIANRYEGNSEKATELSEWNKCSQFKRESNRYAAMAIKVKLNLLGLDLDKTKNPDFKYSKQYNSQYGIDKAFDLRAKRKKLEKEIDIVRNNEDKGILIPEMYKKLVIEDELIYLAEKNGNEFADTPRNNLAMLEHQRWNVFHLANDWTKLPKERIGIGREGRQDGLAKQHACITTFYGLEDLMIIQKEKEKKEIQKKNEKQFIEAESLLKADTIRHDFSTMDFLLDLSEENIKKMREAEGDPKKKYKGILSGSGYYINEYKGFNEKDKNL